MDLSNYNFFPFLIERDTGWCKLMNYFNPYDDPFEYTLSEKIPIFVKNKPCMPKKGLYNHTGLKNWRKA